jgi:hypothetical protein
MKILVACEFSGRVRDAFIARGHEAISCDIIESVRPGPHIIGDVRNQLEGGWDMMVAFPPCTYLANVGSQMYRNTDAREYALTFVRTLLDAPIPKIALENPRGYISVAIRKPDDIIQPWHFGHPYTKLTCLWLKNLPPLVPTDVYYGPKKDWVNGISHRNVGYRGHERSKTFQGIADAMAAQWG